LTAAVSVGKLSAVATRLDHEVDLWWRVVPRRGWTASRWLNAEERAEEARRTARHRRRYVVTRALVRAVLAGYLDRPPASVPLLRGPNGKPRLDGADSLRFNVSHSGAVLVVAVTAGTEIGVDVELVRPVERDAQLARRWFSEADAASLAGAPPALRARRFMELWTRREAIAKLSGDGLWGSSSLDPQNATVGTSVFNVGIVPGYATAVAVTGVPRAVRVLSLASSLARPAGGQTNALDRLKNSPLGRRR
jgi:4'-phosphopantetheinyl transferase